MRRRDFRASFVTASFDERPRVSIIVPVLDEAARIDGALGALARVRAAGHEVIVVDGGSRDDTAARAAPLADRVSPHRAGAPAR